MALQFKFKRLKNSKMFLLIGICILGLNALSLYHLSHKKNVNVKKAMQGFSKDYLVFEKMAKYVC